MLRDDYIMRLIKQLTDALLRIIGKRDAGDFDGALKEVGKAWDDLIGQPPRELVDLVDTHTLAGMLKQPARMRAAARLLVEEGRSYAGKGDPVHATVCFRRAFELLLEARVLARPDVDVATDAATPAATVTKNADNADDAAADDELLLAELARLVPANQLDARYRAGSYGG